MIDLICHCPDTDALVSEVAERFPDLINLEDPENPVLLVPKTPTVRKGVETLSLVRCTQENSLESILGSLDSVTVLGTWDDLAADPAKQAVYDGVYPRTPVEIDGEMHTPPERIGAFA